MSWTSFLVWILSDLLLLLILMRGMRNRMVREYLPFYVDMSLALMVSLSRRIALATMDTDAALYRDLYQWPTYIGPLLRLWILGDIYRRIVGYYEKPWKGFAESITVMGMVTAPIAWGAFSLTGKDAFFSFHMVTLVLQMGFCLQVYRAAVGVRHQVDLGQNLKGVLGGSTLIVGLQAVNFVGFIFSQSSGQIFSFFVPFIYLLALILFAYMMWDFVPMFRLDPAFRDRLQVVNAKLRRVARSTLADPR